MTKSLQNRTFTGTLGAIAEHARIDYAWLRAAFLFLAIVTQGVSLSLYAILWFLIPGPRRFALRRRNRRNITAIPRSFARDFVNTVFFGPYSGLFAILFGLLGLWGVTKQGITPFSASFSILALMLVISSVFRPRRSLAIKMSEVSAQVDLPVLNTREREAYGRPN